MQVQQLKYVFGLLGLTESLCMEHELAFALISTDFQVHDGTVYDQSPLYLSYYGSSVVVRKNPSKFFVQDYRVCNLNSQCVTVDRLGELALSSFSEATLFHVDEFGELEIYRDEGSSQFYICQEYATKTLHVFQTPTNVRGNCQHVRIFESSQYDHPTPGMKALFAYHPFRESGNEERHEMGDLSLIVEKDTERFLPQEIKAAKRLLLLDPTEDYISTFCEQALSRNYEVNVVAKSLKILPSHLHGLVTIIEGDPESIVVVSEALLGVDVVVNIMKFPSIGCKKAQSLLTFYEDLIQTLKHHGVKRIISTTAAERDEQDYTTIEKIKAHAQRMTSQIFLPCFSQISQALEIISASGLQYTILKLQMLHGKPTAMPSPYRLDYLPNSENPLKVSRSNVLSFIFREIITNEWINEEVMIYDQ